MRAEKLRFIVEKMEECIEDEERLKAFDDLIAKVIYRVLEMYVDGCDGFQIIPVKLETGEKHEQENTN